MDQEQVRLSDMEVLHPRCAGLDVSKKDVKVCVRTVQGSGGARQEITTWSAMTSQVLALREHLVAAEVTLVVLESTSDYWKPFYYVLEGGPFEVMLVNAAHAKNVPGRKTDVSDAAWLAQLGAHGLLRASFVPPPPIRELRDLTRARTTVVRDRTRVAQRLEKILEDAGIKLSSVATQITGVSGRAMLEAMVAGQRDPEVLADLARRRLRAKIPQLREALVGRFTAHHAFMVSQHLRQLDALTELEQDYDTRIEAVLEPFQARRDLLTTIPGISRTIADVVIAETGGDMAQFPTPGHLASWTGVSPGQHQSAGRTKNARTRPGDRHLKGALGSAAMVIARHKGTFLHAKYHRLVRSRGKQKALVAIEPTLTTIIWTMLTTGTVYQEPGLDYYQRRDPARTRRRAIAQLESLGLTVHILENEAS